MKPPPLEYERAEDLGHALELLAEHGDEAKPISGGQSLIPLLNLRMARPALLVDINDLPLDDIAVDGTTVTTGALVRHRRLCVDPVLRRANPLLTEAATFIGHAAIRNRGTVGGSIAHADTAAELPLVALACDAEMLLQSGDGSRVVPVGEFFHGPYMTACEPHELVVGIRWSTVESGTKWGFAEIAERSGDFAMAACAITLRAGQARVAVCGVPGSPTRLAEVEAALPDVGLAELRDVIRSAVAARMADSDLGASSATHRSKLVEEMVVRAARQALERSGGAA
ncbi:FAD binding domain-containing protein [Saccharopolyspora sp. NPDC002376]